MEFNQQKYNGAIEDNFAPNGQLVVPPRQEDCFMETYKYEIFEPPKVVNNEQVISE